MSDKPTARVNLRKTTATPDTADSKPVRPAQIRYAVVALAVTAVMALIASLSLYGLHRFLLDQATTANDKLKGSAHKTPSQVLDLVSRQPTASLIQTVIAVLAVAFAARAVWLGRHWSRWAVIGLWALATFTQIIGGGFGVVSLFTSVPIAFKVPSAIASLAFLVAIAFVSVKPSVAYANFSRPERPTPGVAPVRRGLFAPRSSGPAIGRNAGRPGQPAATPPDPGSTGMGPATKGPATNGRSAKGRSVGQQRANAQSVARGAELARARAKAGKSRRTDV